MLYSTGLRISEALNLEEKDVDLIDNFLIVRYSKNGDERIIPISDSLCAVLKQYKQSKDRLPLTGENTNYFFISLSRARCRRDAIYRVFQKILRQAILVRTTSRPRLHDLRHTFSVHSLALMAETGTDLRCALPTLSTYLGHKSLEATNSYIRLTSEMYPGLLKDVDLLCFNVFPVIQTL